MLTMGPHLYYADPVNMSLKGEIPWSPQLRVEPKNFRIFFVHTVIKFKYLCNFYALLFVLKLHCSLITYYVPTIGYYSFINNMYFFAA